MLSQRRCPGDHVHEWAMGQHTAPTSIYPKQMCKDIATSLEQQWSADYQYLNREVLVADGLVPEEIAPPGHESLFKDAKKEAPPTLEELHDADGLDHLHAEEFIELDY